MVQAHGMVLPLWEELLSDAAPATIEDAKARIGASLRSKGPVRGLPARL